MKFRSRVSVLLIVLIMLALAFPAYMAVKEHDIHGIIGIIGAFGIILLTLFGIHYTIEDDKLYVSAFPFVKGKPYDLTKLDSISPTRSLLSSPAASLSRIKLDFGVGIPLIISPAAQDLFIEEVLRINPKVKVNF